MGNHFAIIKMYSIYQYINLLQFLYKIEDKCIKISIN